MKSWIFIGILISMLCGAAFYYYRTTQDRIEVLISSKIKLEENNKQLVTANETNLNTIDVLQESYIKVQEQFNETQTEFQIIRTQNNLLKEKLGRHDLGVLASVKPELVENIINSATVDANRCFELLSGATLNEKERNAKNENQFNKECPWLFYTYSN